MIFAIRPGWMQCTLNRSRFNRVLKERKHHFNKNRNFNLYLGKFPQARYGRIRWQHENRFVVPQGNVGW